MNNLFICFYFLFSINAFCEIECDPNCDPKQALFSIQLEECEHPTCELSHESQHHYTQDYSSESSKKIFKSESIDNKSNYTFLKKLHLSQSNEAIQNNSDDLFFLNKKRYLFLRHFKVFLS